jgi:hypothetical protein
LNPRQRELVLRYCRKFRARELLHVRGRSLEPLLRASLRFSQ